MIAIGALAIGVVLGMWSGLLPLLGGLVFLLALRFRPALEVILPSVSGVSPTILSWACVIAMSALTVALLEYLWRALGRYKALRLLNRILGGIVWMWIMTAVLRILSVHFPWAG